LTFVEDRSTERAIALSKVLSATTAKEHEENGDDGR